MFNHEELKVFCRGKFVDFKDATLSIANTAFLYGLAVFTGMRAHYNEEEQKLFLFRPQEHFERLQNACKLCHYKNFLRDYTYESFLGMLRELVQMNKVREDLYIRVTNFTDQNTITPKFFYYEDALCAFLYPLGNYVPTSGMRCMVSSWTRIEDNAIPARAKFNGAYINTAFAKTEALMRGFDEAIMLDARGHVVEGSAENLFLVSKGTLITPPVNDNILEGITRATIIDLARSESIPVVERSIDRTELYRADEVFLTGTGAQVSPVVEIDGYTVGKSKGVGPISKQLQELYFATVRGRVSKFRHWLEEV